MHEGICVFVLLLYRTAGYGDPVELCLSVHCIVCLLVCKRFLSSWILHFKKWDESD